MILEGKYTILSHSSQDKLIRAQSKKDGRDVAIKKVSFFNMPERQRRRLLEEFNTLQAIKCSNIVKYLDYELDKEKMDLYIIMEYCPKGSVEELIAYKRKQRVLIEERIIWKIFSQVVKAVDVLHNDKKGAILHRNIGPASIFLDQDHKVKLGNFSLLRRLDPTQTLAQTYIPSSCYQSPEQVTSGVFSKQTDIWQLGCLLYQMATLQPPFKSESEFMSADKMFSERKPLPSVYSTELNRVIRFCLIQQPSKRPSINTLAVTPEISIFIRQARINQNKIWVQEQQKYLLRKQMELDQLQSLVRLKELQIEERKQKPSLTTSMHYNDSSSSHKNIKSTSLKQNDCSIRDKQQRDKENNFNNSNVYSSKLYVRSSVSLRVPGLKKTK